MNKENILLSDYEIKGILGKGTFSKVKLGINKMTNEKVAIKIMDKQLALNKQNFERIKRELSILKNCKHPNIIKIHDTKEDQNNFYFIMEYCQYGELFLHIVNNKRLDEKQSSFYFFQLINGLNYLHINNIVHRDLKPENLLLGKGKILKIIDFGLSNYSFDNQYLNTPCGSPSYASPEMIKGKKYNGFISDIWSCGVILYVMLCGYLPFDGFNNNDLFKKILKCKVNYPNNMDKSAMDLLKNILVANPDKRIDVNKIKQHPFYLKGRSIFKQKYPDLINEVENFGGTYNKMTLKKSVSERMNYDLKHINNENINEVNNDNSNNYYTKRNNNLSNSVNKNENKKDDNYNEKNIEVKSNENNLYSNLLCHTKNINYYKKILSGKLNIHKIRKNRNKEDENNETNSKNKNMYDKDNPSSNSKLNISKNSERFSSIKRNKNKMILSNSVNSKELRKKNLEINLKNIPYQKNFDNLNYFRNKNESSTRVKTAEKMDTNKGDSEDKKRISTMSFNENYLKDKYGCHSPNFLLLKKMLKNSINHNNEDEKDINDIQESIVYNAQKETQIFNITHTINKIKKLKVIYENEINHAAGKETKKEYISSNNSNSNFQLNGKKQKNKNSNETSKNNLVFKNHINKNNNNVDVSPIRKIDSLYNDSKGKKSSNKILSSYNSTTNAHNLIRNNDIIFYGNNYFNNEDIKENSNSNSTKKNFKSYYNTNDSNNNLDINSTNDFIRNSNYIARKNDLSKNKNNKLIESERNTIKIPYILTNFNYVDKSPLFHKSKINYSSCKNNSIKVNKNKKIDNSRKKNESGNKKKNIDKQCSLTDKLNSIKKNFNICNKDIFIVDNRKQALMNYISNQNTKINSNRSQKYIKNRSLGESQNNSGKKDASRKRNQYTSLLGKMNISNHNKNNNSAYSELQIKQVKTNDNRELSEKSDSKSKNNYGLFNHMFSFLKKNKNILYNDENQNYNTKRGSKKRHIGLEKNRKYSESSSLSKDYSNFDSNKNNVNGRYKNNNNKNKLRGNKNRSSSVTKGSL